MLRLNASFSKKVPIEGQEYSSQSYHASVEIEIPDGLSPEQLRGRIHETFELVRESVENELGQGVAATPAAVPEPAPPPSRGAEPKASSKQVHFLTQLALERGMDLHALNLICERDFGVASPEALGRQQASRLIDRLGTRESTGRPASRRAA